MVLGMANSRMKDYYDVWMLMTTLDLEADRLSRAIRATFGRRDTAVPVTIPDGLSRAFAEDPAKLRQWHAFARNLSGPVPDFDALIAELRRKLASHSASI